MKIRLLTAILNSKQLYNLGLLGSGKSLNIEIVGGASVTSSHWQASCIKSVGNGLASRFGDGW